MAAWLNRHLPANTVVLASPARRCMETAAALREISKVEVKVAEFLGVDSSVERIAREVVDADHSRTILLIGHQPNLGLLAAKLLGMQQSACVVKKGAVWWLRQRLQDDAKGGALQTYLFAVQNPDM